MILSAAATRTYAGRNSAAPALSGRSKARGRSARIASAALLALGLSLGGCASGSYPVASVTEANSQVRSGYGISAGDQVKVTVFDEPSLTGEFEVDGAGDLSMPLIDKIPVAGRTPQEISNMITAKLTQGGYVLSPKVSVEVLQYRPVYVLGEVSQPGEYPYTPDLTVFQAVAKAGGFTPRANKTAVVLERSGWDQPHEIRLTDQPLMIAPGDTIIVKESFL